MRALRASRRRAERGRIVVRRGDRPLERTRQGALRFYLHGLALKDTTLKDWRVFTHEIRRRSGRHTHQGGIALFVLDGRGYTVVDGRRADWKRGDLILLPARPGGVEHQHFNLDPRRPARWVAFLYGPHLDALGHSIEHKEDA